MHWCKPQKNALIGVLAVSVFMLEACAGGTFEPVRLHPPPGNGAGTFAATTQSQDLAIYRRDAAPGQTYAPIDEAVITPRTPTERVRIGMLLPLSGPEGALGNALLNAAELALFEIDDPWIELIPEDTMGTPAGARAAMEAVLKAGARVVLGPLLSTSVREVAPVAKLAGVNVIAFSTDRSVAGDNVFLIGFSPENEVFRIVEFARSQGLRRFAALVPETAYGERVADSVRVATSANPRDLVRITTYPPQTDRIYDPVRELANYDQRHRALLEMRRVVGAMATDEAAALLRELEEKDTLGPVNFDAVLIAEGGTMLEALAPLLPFYDIDPKLVRFLGTGLWDDRGTLIEPSLEGGWFTGPHSRNGRDFFEKFETAFGYQPPRISSLAYDAMVLVMALQYYDRPDPFSAAALREERGFMGTDGAFRFRADGTAERNLAIMQVGARSFNVIDEAPDVFQPANNLYEAPPVAAAQRPGTSLVNQELNPGSRSTPADPYFQRRDDLRRGR